MLHIISAYNRSLNSWLLPFCKSLCHRLPDVILSVCLLSWTLLKCKPSVLMTLNSGKPDVLQELLCTAC